MALKGDRNEFFTVPHFFLNDVSERGVGVCYGGAASGVVTGYTGGSGAALDAGVIGKNVCQVATTPSGLVALGMLLTDTVNVDTTKYRLNVHKNEVQVGGKVLVMKRGWASTNKISGTPKAGDSAYLTTSGQFTPTNGGAAATPLCGEFMSAKDEDGYATVNMRL